MTVCFIMSMIWFLHPSAKGHSETNSYFFKAVNSGDYDTLEISDLSIIFKPWRRGRSLNPQNTLVVLCCLFVSSITYFVSVLKVFFQMFSLMLWLDFVHVNLQIQAPCFWDIPLFSWAALLEPMCLIISDWFTDGFNPAPHFSCSSTS